MKIILNDEIIMVFTVATSEKENLKKKEKESIKIPSRCVHLITTTEKFSIKNQNKNLKRLRGRKLYIFIDR